MALKSQQEEPLIKHYPAADDEDAFMFQTPGLWMMIVVFVFAATISFWGDDIARMMVGAPSCTAECPNYPEMEYGVGNAVGEPTSTP